MTTPGKRKDTTNLTRKVVCQFCKELFSIGRSYTCHSNKCPSWHFLDPFFLDFSVIGKISHLPATMAEDNTASQPLFVHDSITPQYESHLTTFNNDDVLPSNFDNSSSSSFLINQNEKDDTLLIGSPGSGTNNNSDFDVDLGSTFIDNNPQVIIKPQQV